MRASLAWNAFGPGFLALASAFLLGSVPSRDAMAAPLTVLEHLAQLRESSGLQWCSPLNPSERPIQAPLFSEAALRSGSTEDARALFAIVSAELSRLGLTASASLTVEPGQFANAYIRGEHEVVITAPLAKTVRNSSELAFIFAHELSHIALRHADGASVHDEIRADELALKVVRALGLNPCAGADVLDRLSAPFSATLVSVSPRLRALHKNTSDGCARPPLG